MEGADSGGEEVRQGEIGQCSGAGSIPFALPPTSAVLPQPSAVICHQYTASSDGGKQRTIGNARQCKCWDYPSRYWSSDSPDSASMHFTSCCASLSHLAVFVFAPTR